MRRPAWHFALVALAAAAMLALLFTLDVRLGALVALAVVLIVFARVVFESLK